MFFKDLQSRSRHFFKPKGTMSSTKSHLYFMTHALFSLALSCTALSCASEQKKPSSKAKVEPQHIHDETHAPKIKLAQKKLVELSQNYWDFLAESNPQAATQAGDHRFNDRLLQTGAEHHAKREQKLITLLTQVQQAQKDWQSGTLTEQELISANLLEYLLQDQIAFSKLETYVYDVDQMSGPQANLPYFFATYHPMQNATDVQNLQSRLHQIKTWVDNQISSLQEGIRRQQTAPKVVVKRVIAQLDRFSEELPLEKTLFGKIIERLPEHMTGKEKSKARADILQAVQESVLPAWTRYRIFLQDEYLPYARKDPSLSSMKGGAQLYSLLIQHHTTLELSPEEIHQMGKDALAQIETEMGRLGESQGIHGGAQKFLAHLKKDSRNYASSRDALFSTFEQALARIEKKLPSAFGRLPQLPYEVKPMDATREKDAPAAYYQPGSPKDQRPGVFVANLYHFKERPIFNSDVLAFHEAVPGHHLQFALAQQMTGLPKFRQEAYITAYGEGWGLYSERLCDELGAYTDVNTRMGYLGFAAWRASRLIVDTGLHHFGWSRKQAIDFMSAHTSLGKVDVENEVDRYIVIPGQALSYMVGALHILSLRTHAQNTLGKAFSLANFHDAVLEVGSVPLSVLDGHVIKRLHLPPHQRKSVPIVASQKTQ